MYRCEWAQNDAMQKYHDEEWGIPVHDDKVHFEFLVLESAQAGLSWQTVLKKRENYRKVFAGFDAKKVAKFTDSDVEMLLNNAGIIRNKAKINAAIINAHKFLEVQKEFGSFDKYIWSFTKGKTINNKVKNMTDIHAMSKESNALSSDMKIRGFKFVGPTIMYAHMQAVGIVNDHEMKCFRHKV